MRFGLVCTAAVILSTLSAAHATVIDFNGASDYTQLTTYSESGFSVSATVGIWMYNGYFGNPGPSIYADQANSIVGSVRVSKGGQTFTFSSVDLSNDVAIADFTIQGFNGSVLEYSISGTLPTDPIGHSVFRTYSSGYGDTAITSLVIGESFGGGSPVGSIYNDVNIDNINLDVPAVPPTTVTPEPSSIALFCTGILGLTGVIRKRLA